MRLSSFPWRLLCGRGYEKVLITLADALHRAGFLVVAGLRQWRPLPDPAVNERRLLGLSSAAPHTRAMLDIADDRLWEGEDVLADRFLRPGQRLLDLGCGAGREAFGFAESGLEVVGGDASLALVAGAVASSKRLSAADAPRFVAIGLSRLGFRPAAFDAVLLASAIYARIPGRGNRVRVLVDCRRVLKPDGLLVIEVNAAPYHVVRRLAMQLAVDWPRALARPLLGVSAPEIGDRFVPPGPDEDGVWQYRHRFSRPREVEREMEDAGFAVREWVSSFLVAARR